MKIFKVGDLVEVVIPPEDEIECKGKVEKGALAYIVDGEKEFPEDYKLLTSNFNGFVFIRWIKEDPRWKGRIDGAYIFYRFRKIKKSNILN